ncbi:ATP-binding protein [Pseudoxanthobacter sp. M-2]|uniref:ATP-binding protein n=1 Tax=Pseudoxanthobacter sp. M-2 TaxID=3078754 RepID=UPI0038FC7DCA
MSTSEPIPDPDDDPPPAAPAPSTTAVVLVPLAVGTLSIIALGAAFAVPWPAAAIAVCATGVATAVALNRARPRTVTSRPRDAHARFPDAGVKAALDALPEPAFVVDRRGRLRFANRAAAPAFGTLHLGDPLSFRLRAPSFLEALDRVSTGAAQERIAWAEKVPTERWLEAFIAPLAAPPGEARTPRGGDLVLVLVRDLTEGHMVERMRADFVANASHELRTPLASLTGFIDTLRGPAREDPEARERFLAIMGEQAARMRRLIDDLLSLSRIEMRAHVPLTDDVDVGALLRHVVETLAPVAADGGVAIESDIPEKPLPVRGDRDELVQVFANLVENAVNYGASGGRVVVTARCDRTAERPAVVVAVRDYGPGVAAEHIPRLTERFYRVDVGASRARKGTGLGLAIVKHILNRHRARLSIESPAGGGALFSVRLDALPPSQSESGSADALNDFNGLDSHKRIIGES